MDLVGRQPGDVEPEFTGYAGAQRFAEVGMQHAEKMRRSDQHKPIDATGAVVMLQRLADGAHKRVDALRGQGRSGSMAWRDGPLLSLVRGR